MTESSGATVAELWRYPVKSMRGERIETADVSDRGVLGDRSYAVVDAATGKIGSAKHPRLWGTLLECQASYTAAPEPDAPLPPVTITLPDGSSTGSDDPAVDGHLSAAFGRPVRLTSAVAPEGASYLAVWPEIDGVLPDDFRAQNAVVADESDGTLTDLAVALASPPGTLFDVAALHVVSKATLDALGALAPESSFAVERYRPNVVIDGPLAPFAENDWTGLTLRLGDELTTAVLLPTMRCIMTTLAQADLPRDAGVLRTVARHNRVEIPGLGTWSCVGAYAAVVTAGAVRAGDSALLDATPEPAG